MRSVIVFCLVCLSISCSGPKHEYPRGLSSDSVISRGQMIRILVDVQLVEATLNLEKNRGKDIAHLTGNYYQWLFRKYHISDKRFRNNLDYYRSDPENFSKMYEEVVKNLTDQANKSSQKGKK